MLSVIVVISIKYSIDEPKASVIPTSNSPVFSTVPYILSTVTKTSDSPEVIVTVVREFLKKKILLYLSTK